MATSKKKPTKQATKAKTTKQPVAKKRTTPQSTKVDYYPNRMTVAISALAGTLLVLFALIAVLNS